jgi:uncharacterized protein (TIGR01244 family)
VQRPDLFFSKLVAAAACIVLQTGCAGSGMQAVNYLPAFELEAPGKALPAATHLASGQPSQAGLAAVAAAGFAGVIDLRAANESRGFDEAASAAALGLRYVTLPVAGPDDVSFENAARLDALLASFDGRVLMHCSSGNRAGALLALRAKAAGASDMEALELGRAAGLTQLEDTVRQRLAASKP